jgi:Icc-related predicted phosphoesterase
MRPIYSPAVRERYGGVDLIIGCGDLPYYYLDYVVSMLDVPLFFVRGNHGNIVEYSAAGSCSEPLGGVDLHLKTVNHDGLLMAGVEGSARYSRGPFQYTQSEMWGHVLRLTPGLLRNRILYGSALDIFVSHAPPWGIHDQPDAAHQGIKAFRWLLRAFRPAIHFHGHSHVYHPGTVTETRFFGTRVINTYPCLQTEFQHVPARLGIPGFRRSSQERTDGG